MISRNFNTDYALDDRRLDHLHSFDQYRQKHLLPFFLSKITPPDSHTLSNDGMQRGIRTLSEVAHFVRCIPFRAQSDYQLERVWASPDFVLTMRLGTQEEHALVLASMFRGVKYEREEDLPREALKTKGSKIVEDTNGEEGNLEDRVFVCLGRTRENGGRKHAWVMTFSSGYDHVTLWEPSSTA